MKIVAFPKKRARNKHLRPVEVTPAAIGLHYLLDDVAGISRLKHGKAFRYVDPSGRAVRNKKVLERIRGLAIPPAWTDVWICPRENGHLQATGRDARGRKQYRYHPRWRAVRDETKFNRMVLFGHCLPKIRRYVRRDLVRKGLPREKVLATIVRLLETTLIRVGNEEYVRANNSFGLSSLRDRHAEIRGAQIRFQFVGKAGKKHAITLRDARLARIVKRCRDLPGQLLFQYLDDDGAQHAVTSSDVNEYLREASGEDFTAKDFRTWAGTVLAAMALQELNTFSSKTAAKRNLKRAVESVAKALGNTPTICRKCYVHPIIFDSYLDGTLLKLVKQRAERRLTREGDRLRPEEAAVLAFLQERLARELRKVA